MKKAWWLIFVLVFVSGCTSIEYEDFSGEIKNIQTKENYKCVLKSGEFLQKREGTYIIDNQKDYEVLINEMFIKEQGRHTFNYDNETKKRVEGYECDNIDIVIPEIDFNKKILLGSYAAGDGCTIEFEKEVVQNPITKNVIFNVKVKEKGWCSLLGWSYNWILIPKEYKDIAFKVS